MAAPSTASTNTFNHRIDDGKIEYVPDLGGTNPTYQGQVVTFDSSLNSGNGGIRPATAQADMAHFAGIADQNSVLNSLNEQLPTVRVGFKNVYMLNTTAAETYKHGTKVYLNETVADSMTVTTSTNTGARTVAVGYVLLPNESLRTGITSITGAAGVQIPVAIVANYPVAGIA